MSVSSLKLSPTVSFIEKKKVQGLISNVGRISVSQTKLGAGSILFTIQMISAPNPHKNSDCSILLETVESF